MGIFYQQYIIIGIEVVAERYKKVLSEAVYEEQPRYDTKTGKQTHTEKVLVKQEQYCYNGFGVSHEEFVEFLELAAKKLNVDCVYIDQDTGCLGKNIGDDEDFGRVVLVDGKISWENLQSMFAEVQSKFGERVKLYFASYIG